MVNKRKESWLLKDPNFVPRSKKIRIIIFTINNLILISLFSGHVLLSPMTSSYLAIMVGINYNEGKEKDEILDQKSIKTT